MRGYLSLASSLLPDRASKRKGYEEGINLQDRKSSSSSYVGSGEKDLDTARRDIDYLLGRASMSEYERWRVRVTASSLKKREVVV